MAQVNTSYPDLSQLFGVSSLNPLEYGLQRQEMAQSADKINQQQALQDMLFQEKNDPLKLAQASLQNQGLEAGLPGIFANSSLAQDKANISRQSLGEQIAGAKSKQNADMSDNDLKIIENSAQKMAMSQNPQEREMGVMLLKQHKDIIRDREKQDAQQVRQLAQIREQGSQARLTQQQAIDAGKYVKGVGGGGGGSIQDQLSSGKLSFEKAATLLAGAAFMAEQEGDVEKANTYRQMADQYTQQHIQSRQAGAVAGQVGKPDVGALGGIPTVQRQPVQPFAPVTPKQAPTATEAPQGQVFKQAFGSFEPDKYDYRMGPNGVPQRKPKGK